MRKTRTNDHIQEHRRLIMTAKEIYDAEAFVLAKISGLEDDLQHFAMVGSDETEKISIKADLGDFRNIERCLLELCDIEEGSK